MEFIHSLSDGRKAVIYDEGNNILIIFITNVRNMQSAVLARDYLSALDCVYFRNNLYIVYISNTNEVKFRQVGREESFVLISGTNEVWDVSNLKMFIMNEKIYVSYQIYNSGSETYEIRYINPNGDRKTRLMVSEKERIFDYDITNINEDVYLKIRYKENVPFEYFRLLIDGQEEMELSKEYLVNEKKKNDDDLKTEIEKLREELSRQHTAEIKALEENYTRQYNELSDMTRQVQEEGKKYRELYVQTLNVINQKRAKEETEKAAKQDKTEKQDKAAKQEKTAKQDKTEKQENTSKQENEKTNKKANENVNEINKEENKEDNKEEDKKEDNVEQKDKPVRKNTRKKKVSEPEKTEK